MNGAAPEPPTTTRTPSSRRNRMTGVSHHRRLCRRKYQNSLKNPEVPRSASRANSAASERGESGLVIGETSELPEVAAPFRRLVRYPIRICRAVEAPLEWISEQTYQCANRGNHTIVRYSQKHM